MFKSKKAKRPPPNLSLHTGSLHAIKGDLEKHIQLRHPGSNDDNEVLTLGSDDELDLSNTSTSLDNEYQALHIIRENVKKNLRLRPIKSSSNLRHYPDSIPPPPLSSASDYFTPLSPSAPKQAHPIHPSSLASRLSGNSVWGEQETAGSGRQSLPLLIDTRPPAAHIQTHIQHSINIAIPSLILKRIAKSNNPTATLPTLHSLRQFISTECGKVTWDSYLASYPSPVSPTNPLWDGDIIIYDDDIRSHPKDASFKASSLVAFTLLPLLQLLLPPGGSVDYLYGSISHPDLSSFIVRKATETGTAYKLNSNTLHPLHSTNDATTPGPGTGLFNLDTQLAYKSKHAKTLAYQIESSAATSERPPSPLPATAPKSPSPLSLQLPKPPLPTPLSIPPLSKGAKSLSLAQPPKSPRDFNPPKSPSPLSIPPVPSIQTNVSSNTPSPPPSFLHPPSIPTLRTNTTSLEMLPKLSTSFPSLSLRNRAASSVVPSTQPSIAFAISTAANEEKNGMSRTAPTSPVTHLARSVPLLPSLTPAINWAASRHAQQNSITSPIYSAYYTPPHTPSQVFPSYADSFAYIPPDPPISDEQSHPLASITPKAGRSPVTARGSGEWPPVPPPLPSLSTTVSASSHLTSNHGNGYDDVTLPDYYEPPRTSFNASFDRSFADSPPPTTSSTASEDEGEALPGFVVSTILPGFLYLGPAPSSPSHLSTLSDLGVKRILNMAIECNEDDYGLALGSVFEKYTKIPLRDIVEEDAIPRVVREVCEVLDSARLHSSPTYVHCKAGKSRSVTAVIAYLIHSHHWTLGRAYRFVCERRKGISPNIGFVSELMTFEEEELGGKSIGVVNPSHHGHSHHHGHHPVNRIRKPSNVNPNGDGHGHGASQSISGPIMYASGLTSAASSSTSGSSIGTESSPSLSSSSTLPSDYDDNDSDPPSSTSTPDAKSTVHSNPTGKAGLPVINTTFANANSESTTKLHPSSYHPHQVPLSAQELPSYPYSSHENKNDLSGGSGTLTPLTSNNPSHDPFQELEIRDSSGRYRHARRAPVDEQTLQPMRRVSKAGLESWGWKDGEDE